MMTYFIFTVALAEAVYIMHLVHRLSMAEKPVAQKAARQSAEP
ncbi:hypothetical protein QCK34_004463 [Enterobacter asburiae]